jgi:hypothetical protein
VLGAWLLLSVCGTCAAAEQATGLTCEKIVAVAQTAVRYRDQGYSLEQVLKGLKEVETEGKLSAGEIATLRKTVTAAYLSQATPEEIAVECLRVLGGKKP